LKQSLFWLFCVAGLTAKILDVKTMPDVYGAFYDFTGLLSDKVFPFVLLTDSLYQFCSSLPVCHFFAHVLFSACTLVFIEGNGMFNPQHIILCDPRGFIVKAVR
jgi:hypothetical protein